MDELAWYLSEDLGEIGDITSDALFSDEHASAEISAHEPCVIAGVEEAIHLFEKRKCTVKTNVHDGDFVNKNTVVVEVEGLVRAILLLERLVLNIIGRMSGIATETYELVSICKKINPSVRVSATRKTTPGFRKFEKKAVVIGGGEAHRFGLFDAIMVKDNHLQIAGSVEEAVHRVRKQHPNIPVEIEVETWGAALTAAQLHTEVIMLDNFSVQDAQCVVKEIRQIFPDVLIECSGGTWLYRVIQK